MTYYRRAHNLNDHQGLKLVAATSGVPRYAVVAAWVAIENFACVAEAYGSLSGLTAGWLADEIGCAPEEAKRVLASLLAERMILRDREGSRIVWLEQRSKDPGAAIRMARLRARRANGKGHSDQGNGVTPITRRNAVTDVTPVTAEVTPSVKPKIQALQPLTVTSVTGRNAVTDVTLPTPLTGSRSAEITVPAEGLGVTPVTGRNGPEQPPLESYSCKPESLKKDSPPSLREVPPQGAKAERQQRGRRLPEGFEPDLAEGVRLGLTLEQAEIEAEQFRDHWQSATGKGSAKLDWRAAWRYWCRNAVKFALRGRSGLAAKQPFDVMAEAYRLLEERTDAVHH